MVDIRDTRGFTLIELMVIVAITGVLVAIAIPQFSAYMNRTYTSSSDLRIIEVRQQIEEYYSHRGRLPVNNAALGLPPPEKLFGQYMEQLEIEDGAIHVIFGNDVSEEMKGKILSYRPIISLVGTPKIISWCKGDGSIKRECEDGGEEKPLKRIHGVNRTTPKEAT